MIPGLDWSEVTGWGAFAALATLNVLGVWLERIVPGRAHRRVIDREALKDATIRDQAAALAELKMTSQAAARLLTVLPPLVEQPVAQQPAGGTS